MVKKSGQGTKVEKNDGKETPTTKRWPLADRSRLEQPERHSCQQ